MKVVVPGKPRKSAVDTGFGEWDAVLDANVVVATDVRVSRDAEADLLKPSEVLETDVFELRWQGGIIELLQPEQLGQRTTRDGEPVLAIPLRRSLARTNRDVDDVELEAVRHIRTKAVSLATKWAVPPIVKKLEDARMPDPGVHLVDADGNLGDRVERLPRIDAPYLLLIHGTFSNTSAAFEGLFTSADWKKLVSRYGRRILALEHHTVTTSPADNALAIASAFPEGAPLHLLSHSRGGLVGELLCRPGPWAEDIRRCFADDAYAETREQLTRLEKSRGQLRIERFARVAAPAAGTLLASKRLDRYLNVLLSLASAVLTPTAPWFPYLKAMATAIVASRAEASSMPGLESMMPQNRGFIPFLNQSPEGGNELMVIAGDVVGGSVFDRMKAFFWDLYYQEENDFIVDSASMFRGVPRARAVGFYARAPKADHFSYFDEPMTRTRTVDWLMDGTEAGLTLLTREAYGGLRGEAARAITPVPFDRNLPTVILLPGIMGSRLSHDFDLIWVDAGRLAVGGLKQLGVDSANVNAIALLDSYYEKLYRRLSVGFNVRVFPFDWRLTIDDSAKLLAVAVQEELAKTEKNAVHLLAHSMGGLVSRRFIQNEPGLWKEATARSGRLVMLGTPNFGSFVPAQVFTRQHKLMKGLALLDVTSTLDELTAIVKRFPGLIEMLPRRGATDLFAARDELGLDPNDLGVARAFREALDGAQPDRSMFYVAGHDADTPATMVKKDGKLKFLYTEQGDGTVPWALGLLPNVDTYYVEASHGDLPKHEASFDGYMELLAKGRTDKLSVTPSATSRSARAELYELPDDDQDARVYPNTEDLVASVMGGRERVPTGDRLLMRVRSGDVREASSPVLVGHYAGDPLVSVEAAMNRMLDGALARALALRAYPGEVGTANLFGSCSGPRVLVAGLGTAGRLTREDLERAAGTAFGRYALWAIDCARHDAVNLKVSSVLVGSFGGGHISVEDSVRAIASAVLQLNRRLELEQLGTRCRITELEFIELYRDLAIEAAHAVRRLAMSEPERFSAAAELDLHATTRHSRPASPYRSGWARRIDIRPKSDDDPATLVFDVTTDLARTEPYERTIQPAIVAQLLETSMRGGQAASSTLSQYLLPHPLLERSDGSDRLVLELVPKVANIPWELLGRSTERDEPVALRAGVLRRLTVRDPRANPRHSQGRRALVIGEPITPFPRLSAAEDEANHVREFLSARGMDVEAVIQGKTLDVFDAFYRNEYDIIHIAAHGVTEVPGRPDTPGIVIGDGAYLTADEFQNLRGVPSIVFVNCCHVGRTGQTPEMAPAKAAGLATELIRMGVSVVVAAGWAVSDRPARVFAEELYRRLLLGMDLMESLAAAREKTYLSCSDGDVTWGAYQVYGDPGFVLPYSDVRFTDAPQERSFVSLQEWVEYVRDYQNRALDADADAKRRILTELDELLGSVPEAYLASGEFQAALGAAYAELEEFESAVRHYGKACSTSDSPLRAVEQLGNCEARLAARIFAKDPWRALWLFTRSRKRLDRLLHVGISSERLSLVGATLQRWARTLDKNKHAKHKERFYAEALTYYARAAALDPPPVDLYYPLTNKVAIELILGKEPSAEDIDRIEAAASRQTDVWARGAVADAAVLRFVGKGVGSAEDVAHTVKRVWRSGAGTTERQRSSFVEGVDKLAKDALAELARERASELAKLLRETGL